MNKEKSNKTSFSLIFDPINQIIEMFGVGVLATDTVWNMVLGVLPNNDSEQAKQMMEFSRRDTTEQKVNHITKLTELAELFILIPVYTLENLTAFTYTIRQLSRYTFDDEQATSALAKLKDIYLTFMKEYFYESVKFGKKEEALKNLKNFGEIILEDKDLQEKLIKILAYRPFS